MAVLTTSFRQSFINLSPSVKLILLVLLVLLFALFGSLLAMIVAIPAYNYSLMELSRIVTDPDSENIDVIRFFQIFQSITLFIFPSILAAWLYSEKPYAYISGNRRVSGITLLLVLFSIIVAIPVLNFVTELNSMLDLPIWLDNIEKKMILMEESAAELTELFLQSQSNTDLLINFLMIAILPAIGEEFLFRGLIQKLLGEWFKNSHMAIIITALLFSFIHFQFFGFVPRFMLGLYFGYLLFWSGSIWVPVIAHLINNGLAVLYYHFAGGHVGTTALDNIGTADNSHYLVYLSVFITSVIIGIIYMREKEKKLPLNRNFF